MNTRKIKKAINKNIKVAQDRGGEIKRAAAKKYAKAKKETKKAGDEFERIAKVEYEKVKKQMDATAKKVGDYIKKNPKKAAMISAGIGAALGAVAGLVASSGGRKKKR